MKLQSQLVVGVLAVFLAGGCRKEEPVAAPMAGQDKPLVAERPEDSTPLRLEGDPAPKSETNDKARVATIVKPVNPPTTSAPSKTTTQNFSSGRRPNRPSFPEQPKADESVTGVYQSAGQKVEIDGICSVAETGFECWDMQGQKNAELEQRIQESFKKQEEYNPSGPSVSIRIGKKNRIIVAKTTRQRQTSPSMRMGFLHVQSAGSSPYGSYSGFSLESPNHAPDATEYVNYQVLMASEPTAASETTVRIQDSEAIPESVTIDCKVGGKGNIAGYGFQVVSIAKGGARNRSFSFPGQPKREVWTITLKRTGTPAKLAHVFAVPADSSGHRIQNVDEKGNPVSDEQIREQVQKRSMSAPGISSPMPFLRNATGGTSTGPDGTMQIEVYVNPKKTPKLVLSGSYMKLIDITGIPLDPK